MEFEHIKEHIKNEFETAGVPINYDYKLNDFVRETKKDFISYLKSEHNKNNIERLEVLDKNLKDLDSIEQISETVKAFFRSPDIERDRLRECIQNLNFKSIWESEKPLRFPLYKNKVVLRVSVDKEISPSWGAYIGRNYETARRLRDLYKILFGTVADASFIDHYTDENGKRSSYAKGDYFAKLHDFGVFKAKIYKNGTLELKGEPEAIAKINTALKENLIRENMAHTKEWETFEA